MPHHKSALKRIRSSRRKRDRNRLVKGRIKSAVKTARTLVSSGEAKIEEIKKACVTAEKILSSAATKGVIKKGKARRLISRLMSQLNKRLAKVA
ncbi:MAG: 30S ribosomal protein S20 [Deltaproteobacteria bacterium]|nr:30S ribosomal protein S20 [Deltaproteobacteria bacterium]MCX7952398.1 30S ribosomal protein S20 [Deltaproteobacteria bacterium]